MFPIHSKKNFLFSVTFSLSSANVFNVEQSKNVSFGKELKILLVNPYLDELELLDSKKAISPFLTMFSTATYL